MNHAKSSIASNLKATIKEELSMTDDQIITLIALFMAILLTIGTVVLFYDLI